jgi:hypothetical protein
MAEPIEFNFTVENEDELLEVFAAKQNRIIDALMRKVNVFNTQLQQRARLNAEGKMVQHRTGKLVNSIEMIPATVDASAMISGAVQAGGGLAPYAKFVHDGTAPHRIEAVNRKALAFIIGNRTVFAKYVNHPGTAPRPFLADAAEEMREQFGEDMADAIEEILAA